MTHGTSMRNRKDLAYSTSEWATPKTVLYDKYDILQPYISTRCGFDFNDFLDGTGKAFEHCISILKKAEGLTVPISKITEQYVAQNHINLSQSQDY